MATSVEAGFPTPLLQVRKIESSTRFFERLGFAAVGADALSGRAPMLLRAVEPVDPAAQAVLSEGSANS